MTLKEGGKEREQHLEIDPEKFGRGILDATEKFEKKKNGTKARLKCLWEAGVPVYLLSCHLHGT